jgi:hypothetical protein
MLALLNHRCTPQLSGFDQGGLLFYRQHEFPIESPAVLPMRIGRCHSSCALLPMSDPEEVSVALYEHLNRTLDAGL